jgi:hypothetical protein
VHPFLPFHRVRFLLGAAPGSGAALAADDFCLLTANLQIYRS